MIGTQSTVSSVRWLRVASTGCRRFPLARTLRGRLRHGAKDCAIGSVDPCGGNAADSGASPAAHTQHVKGSARLKSGSQPPPDGYVVAPLLYFYGTDTVRGREGRELPADASVNVAFFGTGYSRVTTRKFFGGTYGFTVLLPIGANKRLESTVLDVNPGAGLEDSDQIAERSSLPMLSTSEPPNDTAPIG